MTTTCPICSCICDFDGISHTPEGSVRVYRCTECGAEVQRPIRLPAPVAA